MAGATRTVTPFALWSAAAAELPAESQQNHNADAVSAPGDVASNMTEPSGSDEGIANGARTGKPPGCGQTDSPSQGLRALTASEARQQTLVFIGRDLDKVRGCALLTQQFSRGISRLWCVCLFTQQSKEVRVKVGTAALFTVCSRRPASSVRLLWRCACLGRSQRIRYPV